MVTSVRRTERVSILRWFITGGLSRLKYYFHYEKDKRLKPENECGTAWSSWLEFLKEMILIREMIKHFHYGNQ